MLPWHLVPPELNCREPARGVPSMAKVMRLRGPTGKGESGLKGASLDLLVHLPQNQSLPALLHCAFRPLFWHYTGGYLPPPFSEKELRLQLINLLGVTRVFQSKNLSAGRLACDRIIHTLATMYMIVYNLSTINSTKSLEYFESLS